MKKNRFFTPGNRKGFTLIEMILVIAIIAILATIGIPTYSHMLPDLRLRSAAQDLYSDLQSAKMDAVKNNNSLTNASASDVVFNTGNGTYTKVDGTIVSLEDEYEGSVEYGNPQPGDTVTFTPVAPDPLPRAIFTARGMAFNDGTIFLKNTKNNYYKVEVSTSGVIQIKKWDGSAWK